MNIKIIALILLSHLAFAQKSRFVVGLDLNKAYQGNILGADQISLYLNKVKGGLVNTASLNFNIIGVGRQSNALFTSLHGLSIIIPVSKNSINGIYPDKARPYLNNSFNLNFIRSKKANIGLMLDSKVLLKSKRFGNFDALIDPKRLVVSTGISVMPLPAKLKIRASYLMNINPEYTVQVTTNQKFYFSSIRIEKFF